MSHPKTDADGYAYPPANERCIVRGEGVYKIGRDGARYLCASAGTFNELLGCGHPAVTQAAVGVLVDDQLPHCSSAHHNPHVDRTIQLLAEIGGPLGLVCSALKGCVGGSSGTEQAILHAQVFTGRNGCISPYGSHHGQSRFATGLSGSDWRKRDSWPPVTHFTLPDWFTCDACSPEKACNRCLARALQEIDDAFVSGPAGPDQIGALIFEPILGAGYIDPPLDFWRLVQEHMRSKPKRVPIVADECQTFARTGKLFAAQHYGVEPDIVVVAKGVSGIGIAGAAAVMMKSEFAGLLHSGERSLTGGGNPLACAAMNATIETLLHDGFYPGGMLAVADHLRDRLDALVKNYREIGCVRGVGLMSGVEVVQPDTKTPNPALAEEIVDVADQTKQLILKRSNYGRPDQRSHFLKIRPAITITRDEVDDLVDRLEFAIKRVCTPRRPRPR